MVNIKPGLKVVIDCASGAGSEISPLVFRKAGCEVELSDSRQPWDWFFQEEILNLCRKPAKSDENCSSHWCRP